MKLYLTKKSTSAKHDITKIMLSWSWSGDKASISRQLSGEIVFVESSALPVPELGDFITMTDDAQKEFFVGVILQRSLGSEDTTMSFLAYDYGYYLHRNDGTYKFTGTSPEQITRLVCSDRQIPISALPSSGIPLRRKFSGVKLDQIITTAWTLAGEKTGNPMLPDTRLPVCS